MTTVTDPSWCSAGQALTWRDEVLAGVYTYTQSRTVNWLVATIMPSISQPRHQPAPPATFLPAVASRQALGGTPPPTTDQVSDFQRGVRSRSVSEVSHISRGCPGCSKEIVLFSVSRCNLPPGKYIKPFFFHFLFVLGVFRLPI